MRAKQRGFSLSEVLGWAVVLGVLAIMGLRLWPAYTENAAIENAFIALASDPKLQKAKPDEIRAAFAKRALIENMKSITLEQIQIDQPKNAPMVVHAEYFVKLPLAGNVFLYVEFKPSSANAKAE